MSKNSTQIYSIHYDEDTSENIPDGFTGLCNKNGPAHLYEFFRIHKFLQENKIAKQKYIGFFSPRFFQKTKITAKDIRDTVDQTPSNTDVCLFSSAVDEASLFPNVWIQGDGCHPGLIWISQKLALNAGYSIDLKRSINSLETAVFSHYLVAQSEFWDEWLRVANIYLDMMKCNEYLRSLKTYHRGKETLIHAFVMERVQTMILNCKKFQTFYDTNLYKRQDKFKTNAAKLMQLDECKRMFTKTKNRSWLDEYAVVAREYLHENYVE
jgi:hypothetical protein